MQKLGQHFLINKQIVADIIRAGGVSKKDIVLEVGPGKGILTEALAKKAKMVIAVEKDKKLVEYLKDKFSENRNVEIIHGDILKVDISNYGLRTIDYKLIANIPYYITSRFLRMFLSGKEITPTPNPLPLTIRGRGRRGRALLPRPSLMVLMIQREVAERIVARDGKESLLSLSVKAYGKPEIIKIVKRGNFFPPPKVDSAIIKIVTSPHAPLLPPPPRRARVLPPVKGEKAPLLNKEGVGGGNTEQILSLARKAFQQKRKMLRHSLGKNIPEKYQNKRPEELGLEDWKKIINPQPQPLPPS